MRASICHFAGACGWLLAAISPASGQATSQEEVREASLREWQDERFGMFVHWGVYAVPAGVHNGKPVRHLGEWIMHHGRIKRDDYRKYAERFDPQAYDPAAWVALAKDTGMKYLVVTAKHHDGFALFDTAASEWNSTDASGAKRDLLMPLVEECRREGLPLGFHYSQALDWWHPGGGRYGSSWDPAQTGSFDDYLANVAVPQIKELLDRYGPVHCFFFDTPAEMNALRARQVEAILPPATLTNDRLYPGYRGSFRSFEGQLPREFFPRGPWELCMTINDSWGYKSGDHNWKSAGDLKRTLVETASRGGNFLLNVGPDASGAIPAPAMERLQDIGRWMARNGESIHRTRRSVYSPIPWNGGCTSRELPSGETVIYMHLFEQPDGGQLILPGLTNKIVSAAMLGGSAGLDFSRQGNSWRVKLPPFGAGEMPVVKVTVEGAPVIQSPSLTPDQDGKLLLSATTAVLKGDDLRLERQSDSLERNIGFWTRQADSAGWSIDLAESGYYATEWNLACAPDSSGAVVALMIDGKELDRFEIPSTGGWNAFRKFPGPMIALPAGTSELLLVPLSKPGLGVLNLRALSLAKSK